MVIYPLRLLAGSAAPFCVPRLPRFAGKQLLHRGRKRAERRLPELAPLDRAVRIALHLPRNLALRIPRRLDLRFVVMAVDGRERGRLKLNHRFHPYV